ncbi:hypothetical protein SAMN05216370_0127 [Pseudomonas peli]|uniref:F-box domain-containing protein n=1 Tax=Pseudomonas peli TaxID=592361 RepID=A0AB37ZDN7_9PSED|nr:hypothetical protein [Pseudomonas peli]NMZ71362.1 hypothetical protein [Pseudomonas peli]SCW90297.1 hypothetical protein SAMN05216370_0127 [Pseudomonas peli]
MADARTQAALKTPLSKLGELPPEVFLSCLAAIPALLQDACLSKWSAQLNTKHQTKH